MKPVLICGGIGSKMWPVSRQTSPKHFLPLLNGKSLMELNWEALRRRYEPCDIYLQTNAVQAEMAKKLIPEIVAENVFVEPEMRNHGPATGFAAAMLLKRGIKDEPFMLIQTDDLRQPEDRFLDMMEVCDELARSEHKYITGGIKFDFGVMGVDYLKLGELVSNKSGVKVYKVAQYLPRGTKELADEYIKAGALVHTNHTCMTPADFLEMYKKYKMDWYEPLMRMVEGGDIESEYAKMPKGPIEEVTQKVHEAGDSLVVELPFVWTDFGTWESLANYLGKKKVQLADDVLEIASNGNFYRVPSGKFVANIGVSDVVLVDTKDAILICKKELSGRVGEVVDFLKEKDRNELL